MKKQSKQNHLRIFFKRFLSLALTLVLLSMVSSLPFSSQAAVVYDATAALSYAQQHWNESGDCASFVSACFYAGGLTCTKVGNSYIASCTALWNTLPFSDIPSHELTYYSSPAYNYFKMSDNSAILAAGDPIFSYCSKCQAYMHVVICAGSNSAGDVIGYAHNDPQNADVSLPMNKTCYTEGCGGAYKYYSRHINYSTGRINVDFSKDGDIWPDPAVGSATYAVNTTTGKKYTMTQNPDFAYAYRTADTLPYGTYNVYVKSGTGSGAIHESPATVQIVTR